MARWSLRWRFGTHVGLAVILVLGILVMVALIAERHPYRVDLTARKTHTLSPQTHKILKGLRHDIRILAFYFKSDQERDRIEDLLNAYRYLSSHIKIQFVDPELEPAVVRKYDVKSAGTVVLEGFGKTQTVTLPSEESITNALIRLTSSRERKVYFLTGHGERDIEDSTGSGYSQLKEALEKEGYKTAKLMLLRRSSIPADATVVVVPNPRKALLPAEIHSLTEYLQKGGRVVVLLPPFEDGGLKGWLAGYGVRIRSDIVVDPLSRAMGSDYLVPIVKTEGKHKIAVNTRSNMLFPQTRSVLKEKSIPEGVSIDDLVVTSPGSWAETDEERLRKGEVEFNRGVDLRGPFDVGVAVTIQPKKEVSPTSDNKKQAGETAKEQASGSSKGELIVYGNADFPSNGFLAMLGNRDLILNTIGYLAEDRNLVSIRTKKPESQTLILSRNQSRVLFWVSLVLVPGLALVAGLAVYRVRRRSR